MFSVDGSIYESLMWMAGGKPTIDLDVTFLIQLAVFIGLWMWLTPKLFKPYLAAREERETRTSGARDAAGDLTERADTVLADYESKLQAALNDATGEREQRVNAGQSKAEALITSAQDNARDGLDKARKALGASTTKARKDIDQRAKELSKVIADKVLA